MTKGGSVYFMTNKRNNVLYTGATSDLPNRVIEHKRHKYPHSFTARYNCEKLVYFENFSSIVEAIAREKEIKGWKRFKKDHLINGMNPRWEDLYPKIKNW